MNTISTFYELRHIERLSRSLHHILGTELSCPVTPMRCVATIAQALSLRPNKGGQPDGYWAGLPWSSYAAFQHLAGLGYVSDPRLAMEAVARVEERHILQHRKARRIRTDRAEFPRRKDAVATTQLRRIGMGRIA